MHTSLLLPVVRAGLGQVATEGLEMRRLLLFLLRIAAGSGRKKWGISMALTGISVLHALYQQSKDSEAYHWLTQGIWWLWATEASPALSVFQMDKILGYAWDTALELKWAYKAASNRNFKWR